MFHRAQVTTMRDENFQEFSLFEIFIEEKSNSVLALNFAQIKNFNTDVYEKIGVQSLCYFSHTLAVTE